MDQVLAIRKVREKLDMAMQTLDGHPSYDLICEAQDDLFRFLDQGVDYKEVVDAVDESILISDPEGTVIYVNPAYETNTGIAPNEILGKNVSDIVKEGRLFTGGATLDVIAEKKKVFRLATIHKASPPQVGYTIGVPIFDKDGELAQVVVTSRPIFTLNALIEDFEVFLSEFETIRANMPVRIHDRHDDALPPRKLIGAPAYLETIYPIIERAAYTDATVLITGESGVGKEIVADEIYAKSSRDGQPYVKVNCASIPSNLLESELFGYEKGAFSGASTKGKKGLFELANHGTLLLDEIGDMPIDMQAKLLRVLQDKKIYRIGGTKPIALDVRFIASTNSNLTRKIQEGGFRKDLFYRLSVIPIHLPPLRENLNSLGKLCTHFITNASRKYNRSISLSAQQLNLLRLYNWPGNIRELENVIEYLVICSSGTGNVDDDVIKGILNISLENTEATPVYDLNAAVGNFEKDLIEKVLHASSNLREAAQILNVNASTVSRKIRQYAINYPNARYCLPPDRSPSRRDLNSQF
ncbi:MAG: sigma 54-interacting transcriptional regulator [Clostridiales Family XIII bacterium]|jgi:PAS domain S-box-containing protein|nr:sigma 54-interacting transcriptional regulator [Clostridiales Family XIII bacterium]